MVPVGNSLHGYSLWRRRWRRRPLLPRLPRLTRLPRAVHPPRRGGALLPVTITRLPAPLPRPAHARLQRARSGRGARICGVPLAARDASPRADMEGSTNRSTNRPAGGGAGPEARAARRVGPRAAPSARAGGAARGMPEFRGPGASAYYEVGTRCPGTIWVPGRQTPTCRPNPARCLCFMAHKLRILKYLLNG